MKKTLIFAGIVVALALVVACGAGGYLLRKGGLGPRLQEELSGDRIYAYRDWQSVGVQVGPGDTIYLRARGTWLYTPEEYHGPEGHRTYPAPNTYPINGVAGGVLIGRIGEGGRPFLVGRGRTLVADREGMLYLRINDDILSDNEGFVSVEVEVEVAEVLDGSSP